MCPSWHHILATPLDWGSPEPNEPLWSAAVFCLRRPMGFCYECGRSLNVTLAPCPQCKQVLLCSKACQLKHKADCDNLIAGLWRRYCFELAMKSRLNKYAGPPYCRAEMQAGRVACCPWWVTVSMPKGHTDGRTPDRYIALYVRRGQRNNANSTILRVIWAVWNLFKFRILHVLTNKTSKA